MHMLGLPETSAGWNIWSYHGWILIMLFRYMPYKLVLKLVLPIQIVGPTLQCLVYKLVYLLFSSKWKKLVKKPRFRTMVSSRCSLSTLNFQWCRYALPLPQSRRPLQLWQHQTQTSKRLLNSFKFNVCKWIWLYFDLRLFTSSNYLYARLLSYLILKSFRSTLS